MLDTTAPAVISMTAGDLANALRTVRYAISTEKIRYYLQGVLLEREADNLILTATDGHRLASTRIKVDGAAFAPVILPAQAVADILKSDIGKPGKRRLGAGIAVSPGRIAVGIGSTTVVECGPINGTYPDYRRVLPAAVENPVQIPREPFLAVARAFAAALKAADAPSTGSGAVRLTFAGHEMKLSCAYHVDKESTLDLAATIPLPEPAQAFEIGFQARYLAQTLAAMTAPAVLFSATDAESPARFTGHTDDGLHVLMPCRLPKEP